MVCMEFQFDYVLFLCLTFRPLQINNMRQFGTSSTGMHAVSVYARSITA